MEYTLQKAIANIDEVLNSTLNYDDTLDYQLTTDDCDWLEIAKSALEKQVFLKPLKQKITVGNTIYKRFHCPYCKSLLAVRVDDETGFVDSGKHMTYCDNCGQALLDWSENE